MKIYKNKNEKNYEIKSIAQNIITSIEFAILELKDLCEIDNQYKDYMDLLEKSNNKFLKRVVTNTTEQ